VKNRTETNDVIATDNALDSFKAFVTLMDVRAMSNGIRNLLLSYLFNEIDGEEWFENFLPELRVLFDFLDELEAEYSHQ
jgi:hypothetical protein